MNYPSADVGPVSPTPPKEHLKLLKFEFSLMKEGKEACDIITFKYLSITKKKVYEEKICTPTAVSFV